MSAALLIGNQLWSFPHRIGSSFHYSENTSCNKQTPDAECDRSLTDYLSLITEVFAKSLDLVKHTWSLETLD